MDQISASRSSSARSAEPSVGRKMNINPLLFLLFHVYKMKNQRELITFANSKSLNILAIIHS